MCRSNLILILDLSYSSPSPSPSPSIVPRKSGAVAGALRVDEECVKVGEAAASSGGVHQGIGSL